MLPHRALLTSTTESKNGLQRWADRWLCRGKVAPFRRQNPPMTITDPRMKHVPGCWSREIEEWSEWLRAAGRSSETILTRTDHLRRTARALAPLMPGDVKHADLMVWVGRQKWAPETRRSFYASLRSFFAWWSECHGDGVNAATDLPQVRAGQPRPRPCPTPVVRSAAATAPPRVHLMIRLGAELGLRRAEIAQVNDGDLFEDEGWWLRVLGKGRVERLVPVRDDLAEEIRAACRRNGGFAFPGRVDGHLSARYVGKLLSEWMPGAWTGHTLRHRFGTVAFTVTHDLVSVSRLLGHQSVATTQRYVATDAARLREVAAAAAI